MLKVLGVLAIILLVFGNIIYSGFVFSTIWGYFIVPLGVAALSIPHALGIISVAFYPFFSISMKLEKMHETEWSLEKAVQSAIGVTIMISLIWGICSIYRSFM